MKNLRLKNPENIIFLYLNINSVRNKFKKMENVDILTVVKNKLDLSFPTAEFLIPDFQEVVAY